MKQENARIRLVGLVAITLMMLIGCAQESAPVAQTIGLTSNHTIEFDGVSRSYMLHLPNNLKPDAPIVFVLHGYGGSSEGIHNYSKMNRIAAKYGFAVCYPEALVGSDGSRSWNVGYSNYGVNDVGYLSELAAVLPLNHQLSSKSLFCTGMSNGGDMTIQMTFFKPDLFRAVAPVAGTLMNWIPDSINLAGVTSFLMINGTNDNITLWAGDENYFAFGLDGYMGTRETIDLFVDTYQCMGFEKESLPDLDRTDGSSIIREKYSDCNGSTQIWLYEVVDGGHDWPGAWGNRDINASEEMWLFFEQFIE